MKTIEERAKSYQQRIVDNNPLAEAYDFYGAYLAGAKEQLAIDIEKAQKFHCKWCRKTFDVISCKGCHYRLKLHKSMEE